MSEFYRNILFDNVSPWTNDNIYTGICSGVVIILILLIYFSIRTKGPPKAY